MDELTAWMTWAGYAVAKAGLFAWLSGNNEDADDETIAEAHEFILGSFDADQAAIVEELTGKNNRDLTVEQLEYIHEEMKLRRFERRN